MRKNAIWNLNFLVFSRDVFSHGVFSSFRLALNGLVVFSHGVFLSFRGEKTPCKKTKKRNNAMRKDEITPREKTKKTK